VGQGVGTPVRNEITAVSDESAQPVIRTKVGNIFTRHPARSEGSEMIEQMQAGGLLFTGAGLMFSGVALILRERYRGQALLIRARRGDPEVPHHQSSLIALGKRVQ
jgi:hypothetical protein